jgi:hypothetical protein
MSRHARIARCDRVKSINFQCSVKSSRLLLDPKAHHLPVMAAVVVAAVLATASGAVVCGQDVHAVDLSGKCMSFSLSALPHQT